MPKKSKATTLPALAQDPHAVRAQKTNSLEAAIGYEVRELRKQHGITINDLSVSTGVSVGMLSKIERGGISPSLTTLQLLANALGVPVTAFFRGYERPRSAVFVKAGEGVDIERRGTRAGHQYSLLGHLDNNTSGVTVEPYLISLNNESDVFPTFQHEGLEFIYMLQGEIVYRHGDNNFTLTPGDSLLFDADAQHGPQDLVKLPAKFITVISYTSKR